MFLKGIQNKLNSQSLIAFSIVILISCFLNFSPKQTYAQACCSGGVPLSGVLGIGLGASDFKSLQIMLSYDYNNLSTLMDGTQILKDQIRQRTTHSSILEVNYGLSKRITLTGILPYIKQGRSITSFDGSAYKTTTNGIGDALVLLKYRLSDPAKQSDFDLAIGGGIKVPSGRTDYTNSDGFILVADMQAGSGSLDGILWMYFQKHKFIVPNLSFIAVTTYRVSGENNSYNTSQTYIFGNEFQTNLGFNYSFFAEVPVNLFAFFRYRSQKVDLIDGNTYPGSGGKWAYLIPGLNIDLNNSLSLRVSADLPIYRNLNGTQLTTSYKITTSLLYRFPTKRKVKLLTH